MFATLLGWIVLHTRSDTSKRHRDPRPAPPARRAPTTQTATADTLDRPRPDHRPHPTTPATILRWHHELIIRRWTTQPVRPGRPAIPAGLRTLILRLPPRTPPGDIDASTASSRGSATRSEPPPSGES